MGKKDRKRKREKREERKEKRNKEKQKRKEREMQKMTEQNRERERDTRDMQFAKLHHERHSYASEFEISRFPYAVHPHAACAVSRDISKFRSLRHYNAR